MSKKTTKVYKVVEKTPDGFVSSYAPSWASKVYKIGKKTLPIAGTKLFAFTDLKAARHYARNNVLSLTVLVCEATGVKGNGWLADCVWDLPLLQQAFQRNNPLLKTPPYPYGLNCVLCDSITPKTTTSSKG